MLDLEVVPARSLGCDQWEFILGMHFSQAVAIIQSLVGTVRGVQVLYSETAPLSTDLVIKLPQDGIRLVFDPIGQRLKIIEVYNMKLVKLKYCGIPFNSAELLPSIEQVEHSFGATHPGVFDTERQLFVLNFRGLCFNFPVESKFQPGYAHGLGSLQFAAGGSPVAAGLSLFSGPELVSCKAPPLPLSCYRNHLYLERAEVLRDWERTTGLRLHLVTEGSSRHLDSRRHKLTRDVMFGDSCQDVATALGAPSKVFFKAEDKMKIHSPNAHRRAASRRSDFFHNYFSLGVDVLFDAKTQQAKKLVLHTNFPGHYNFNMYHRCEFHMRLGAAAAATATSATAKPVDVSAYTKWDEISEQLKPSERPVVLNRASSTNTTNPFGSTFCYGFQDIIFEVMPNNYIASLTLYRPQDA